MAASTRPRRFTAAIRKQGMNYCVDVPDEAGRALAGEPPERHPRLHEVAHFNEPRRGSRAHHPAFYAEMERLVAVWFGADWTIERRPWTTIVSTWRRDAVERERREKRAERRRILKEDEAALRENRARAARALRA